MERRLALGVLLAELYAVREQFPQQLDIFRNDGRVRLERRRTAQLAHLLILRHFVRSHAVASFDARICPALNEQLGQGVLGALRGHVQRSDAKLILRVHFGTVTNQNFRHLYVAPNGSDVESCLPDLVGSRRVHALFEQCRHGVHIIVLRGAKDEVKRSSPRRHRTLVR